MEKEYRKKSIQENLNIKKLTTLFFTVPKWQRAQRFTPQIELQEIKAFTLWHIAGDMDQKRNTWSGVTEWVYLCQAIRGICALDVVLHHDWEWKLIININFSLFRSKTKCSDKQTNLMILPLYPQKRQGEYERRQRGRLETSTPFTGIAPGWCLLFSPQYTRKRQLM